MARTFTDLTFTTGAIIGASSIPISVVTALALSFCMGSDNYGKQIVNMSRTLGIIGAPLLSRYIFEAINLPPVTPLTAACLSGGIGLATPITSILLFFAIKSCYFAIHPNRQQHAN